MRKPIYLTIVAAILLAMGLRRAAAQTASSQILTLPSGERYEFAGVTYDTINKPPPSQKYAGVHITQYNEGEKTDLPQLFIWFQSSESSVPTTRTTFGLIARLANENGIERGETTYPAFDPYVTWDYVRFPVIPRRSKMLRCNFYRSDQSSSDPIATITFTNPLYGDFPEWKPEPLPAVKMAADLQVRLVDLKTGIRAYGEFPILADGKRGIDFQPAEKGVYLHTFFDVLLKSEKGTNEEWVVQNAELTDATGNVFTSPMFVGSSGDNVSPMTFLGECRLFLPVTLWPDETAWKLKLELKRKSGFSTEEFTTFKGVPVPTLGATNFPPITNIVDGVQLVLTEFVENGDRTSIRYPRGTNANFAVVDRTPETMVAVELPGHPKGFAVDFVKIITDTGETFEKHGNTWRPFYRAANLKFIPTNVKTVDITWVVQKIRSVEFLVKPPEIK